jgi:hypothetical protein
LSVTYVHHYDHWKEQQFTIQFQPKY